eukprot:57299-Amphidinium_carterae.1
MVDSCQHPCPWECMVKPCHLHAKSRRADVNVRFLAGPSKVKSLSVGPLLIGPTATAVAPRLPTLCGAARCASSPTVGTAQNVSCFNKTFQVLACQKQKLDVRIYAVALVALINGLNVSACHVADPSSLPAGFDISARAIFRQ